MFFPPIYTENPVDWLQLDDYKVGSGSYSKFSIYQNRSHGFQILGKKICRSNFLLKAHELYVTSNFAHPHLLPSYGIVIRPEKQHLRTEILMPACVPVIPSKTSLKSRIDLCYQLLDVVCFLELDCSVYHYDMKINNLVFCPTKGDQLHLYLIDFGLIEFDLSPLAYPKLRPSIVPQDVYDDVLRGEPQNWRQQYKPYQLYLYSIGVTLLDILNPRSFSLIDTVPQSTSLVDFINTDILPANFPDTVLRDLIGVCITMSTDHFPDEVQKYYNYHPGQISNKLIMGQQLYVSFMENFSDSLDAKWTLNIQQQVSTSLHEILPNENLVVRFIRIAWFLKNHPSSDSWDITKMSDYKNRRIILGTFEQCLVIFPALVFTLRTLREPLHFCSSRFFTYSFGLKVISIWLANLHFNIEIF